MSNYSMRKLFSGWIHYRQHKKVREKMKTVLTIAGSDSSGGAGIQADIKTITAHKVYASSAITALTAQNTTGVMGVLPSTKEFLAQQIDAVCTDIAPDAVKIGMVFSKELIEVIVEKYHQYQWKNVVIDPVMISTSGHNLLQDDAISFLNEKMLCCGDLITPNLMETEELCGFAVNDKKTMETAACQLAEKYQTAVLVKAGHCVQDADDLLVVKGEGCWITGSRIETDNTHGTGCTLSSAIASHLALGASVKEAVKGAKEYVTGALKDGMNLGQGSGPLNHMWKM